MEDTNLPFKPGDCAEARSFESGFRGAWFRCKIKEISKRRGEIGHVCEYFDFPDEKLKWAKLYQLPPHLKKTGEKHRVLVLRPSYPPVIKESETPDASDISEVTVIVNDAWKVGDLVDWWTTGCFWSGKIIELSGDDKAKIELHPPPRGEGSTYDDVLLNDVRPSLDWTPEHGWTIPAQDSPPCVRIIKPMNEVMIDQENTIPEEAEETQDEVMIEHENTVPEEGKETTEGNMNVEHETVITRETESAVTDKGNHLNNGTCPINSMPPDQLAAAVMDLEKCLNKVKRLKEILQLGIASSDASKDQWEYVYQHGSPSAPK